MEKAVFLGLVGLVFVIGFSISLYYSRCSAFKAKPLALVQSPEDVSALFVQTPETIKRRVACAIAHAKKEIDALIALPDDQRTFANTFQVFDTISCMSDVAILFPLISTLEMMSPDSGIRDAAHDGQLKLQEFFVDQIGSNEQLYKVLKAYASRKKRELLTAEQEYFIDETIKEFEREGLALPAEQRARVGALKKEIAALALTFEKNIAQDNKTISVFRQELAGLDTDFIDSLRKVSEQDKTEKDKTGSDQEQLEIAVNAPNMIQIMKHCSVGETRKKMHHAWQNRAYPANEEILKAVIAKRDELAKILGFESYAAYAAASLMAKRADTVYSFLQELISKSLTKEKQEFEQLYADLPASVEKNEEGKVWAWDVQYAKEQYKKKNFSVDDQHIAQYFPTEKTIEKVLAIYQQFFSLVFRYVPVSGLWHEQTRLLGVYRTDGSSEQLLGYLLLDLYPRANKYGHAAYQQIVPSIVDAQGEPNVSVAIVVANFPQSTSTKPALLTHGDVETFFHEFGHAMHGLLGRTQLASQSGTNVRHDFVEVPSQMLEEWLWDAEVLTLLSGHYQTGQPLPKELIEKIIALKKFDSGYFIQRQAQLSLLDHAYFVAGAEKDPYAILQKQLAARSHVAYSTDDHMYASFGHLMGYGAKYYSYMWSKVYSLDLFVEVKKEGLANPLIGKRLVVQVLGRGGAAEPAELLQAFLGRESNMNAFLKDLGL